MLFPDTLERRCARAILCLQKATKVSRELLARDPSISLQSTPIGFYCHFSNGETRLVLECVLCVFDRVCTLQEKRKSHSQAVTAHQPKRGVNCHNAAHANRAAHGRQGN
jgi:hypothetical protein